MRMARAHAGVAAASAGRQCWSPVLVVCCLDPYLLVLHAPGGQLVQHAPGGLRN
jgi:hypothetical protein